MKSIATKNPVVNNNFALNNEIIILPFIEEEDLDQIMLEMKEEEMVARENGAMKMMEGINRLNLIRMNEFSRVA